MRKSAFFSLYPSKQSEALKNITIKFVSCQIVHQATDSSKVFTEMFSKSASFVVGWRKIICITQQGTNVFDDVKPCISQCGSSVNSSVGIMFLT